MVAILIDSKYADSLWCKKMHNGLIKRLRAKRISFCEIYNSCPTDIKTVFIIGADYIWLGSVIKQLNKNNIVPIVLCNQLEALPGCIYNSVCTDLSASMIGLLNILKAKHKHKVAIYGVNPSSLPDLSRTDSLMLSKDEYFEKMTMFVNEGSLNECYSEFSKSANEYDCVICMNDFAAVSLVRHLKNDNPKLLDNLFIISCTSSKLLDYYRDYIVSFDKNFADYGKAAVYIYENLQKNKYITGLTVKIGWELNSDNLNQPNDTEISISTTTSSDSFFSDPELADILILDKLLTFSDEIDKFILKSFVEDLSVEEISQKCFLSTSAIKYRIKNLISVSGAEDRRHIIRLMKNM